MASLLRAAGVAVEKIDLEAALAADQLNTNPPDIAESVLGIVGWLDQSVDALKGITRLGR